LLAFSHLYAVLRNLVRSEKFSSSLAMTGVILDKGVPWVSSQGTGYNI
jgi:minichromosome maintenance protein 10